MLRSIDPATGGTVWSGPATAAGDCEAALTAARVAAPGWARTPLAERVAIARRYAELLQRDAAALAELISRETGKVLWDSRGEVAAMIGKVEISIRAQAERAGETVSEAAFGRSVLRHRPHGVMAVFGPYNFPGHLPNGHIVPALLAGNCAIFKPSEETPAVGEAMVRLWHEAGLPGGVLQLVQGGRETGATLLAGDIDGLLFTGSAEAGRHFRRLFVDRPEVILALELGGNNPLVAWDGDPLAAASLIVHSAFVTTGQRCSCARRLILPAGPQGDAMLEALVDLAVRLPVGAWNGPDEAFMGPLISAAAAQRVREAGAALVASGARTILAPRDLHELGPAFLAPAILDVTGLDTPDREIFGPLLQVIRVDDFTAAMADANRTAFGLAAGLISDDPERWEEFRHTIRAGVVNLNRPTTGASSAMPFGGVGESGNHRPSAAYAADYCAYPAASFEAERVEPIAVPGLG